MPYFCNNTNTEGSFAYAALQSCFTKRGVSVVKYKPMFAFFFKFVLVWIFVCLFLFLSRSISLSLFFFFSTVAWSRTKLRFFSSCLLLFLGKKKEDQGACLLFLPSRYCRHKALRRGCTNPCCPWQKNGRRWERPGILPGSADFRNEDCTRLSPEPKG